MCIYEPSIGYEQVSLIAEISSFSRSFLWIYCKRRYFRMWKILRFHSSKLSRCGTWIFDISNNQDYIFCYIYILGIYIYVWIYSRWFGKSENCENFHIAKYSTFILQYIKHHLHQHFTETSRRWKCETTLKICLSR